MASYEPAVNSYIVKIEFEKLVETAEMLGLCLVAVHEPPAARPPETT